MIEVLISQTGDWGIDLGRRLLVGAAVPISVKTGAAKALTDAWLQLGDARRALDYAQRIELKGTNAAFQQQVANLMEESLKLCGLPRWRPCRGGRSGSGSWLKRYLTRPVAGPVGSRIC